MTGALTLPYSELNLTKKTFAYHLLTSRRRYIS